MTNDHLIAMKLSKFCIPLFINVFLCNILPAQNTLSGKVTDEAGSPLMSATIYVPELKTGTTTDLDGSYQLSHLPSKKLLLQVSYIGFGTETKTVEVNGKMRADFALSETHIEAEEVVVTGLSTTQNKRRNPVSIDILKKDFLLKSTGSNLIDGLTKVPGVSSISTGPGISKPLIRGLGSNRVLVVQDGIRQEGQQWGDEHGVEIDEFSVDRVEIFRGPASLMYGSDGLGGVLSFESAHPVEEGTVKANFLSSYHTNNRQQGYSLFAATNINGWNGYLRGSYIRAEDFRNSFDGKVFNSSFDEHNFSGMAGVNRKWGYSHIHFSLFHQEPDLTEGDRNSDGSFRTDKAPFQIVVHRKVSWNSNLIFKNSSLKMIIGFQNNLRREFEEPGKPNLFFDLKTVNYDLKYYLFEQKNWEYTIGINGMVQNNTNRALEVLVPDYDLHDEGTFAYAKRSWEKLEFSAGLRYDHRNIRARKLLEVGNEIRFNAFNRNFSNVTGSVGLSWLPSKKVVVKFNLARGFRSPNIAELASNGVHEGTFRYELGNTDLTAESNLELDAGIEYNSEHVSLHLNPFYNFIDNYIFLEKLSAISGGDSLRMVRGEAFSAFRFVQGKARLYGGEFTVDIHPHPLDWLHFKNTFSLVLAKQKNTPNKYLPFIPAPKYNVELRTTFNKKGKYLRNLFVETDVDYHFAQNRVLSENGFETPTPHYGLWNASLGFDWIGKKGQKVATFFLSGQNLLDKGYQDHLNRLKFAPENLATGRIGVFNLGRNFVLKLVVPMEWRIHHK